MLSDAKVVEFLKSEVVPVWESVRSVPKVTFDFGDGKKIERTLAGNTVIYFCSPNGKVVDAFPGIYAPEDFLKEAADSINAVEQFQKLGNSFLAEFHKKKINDKVNQEVQRTTFSKAFVESPLLKALGYSRNEVPNGGIETTSSIKGFEVYLEDISKKAAAPRELRRMTEVKGYDNLTPEQRGNLLVQIDSTQNLRVIRPATHLFLLGFDTPKTPRELRDAIYKNILQIPLNDPYLGLADVILPGTPGGG